jgi:hypothetical protein
MVFRMKKILGIFVIFVSTHVSADPDEVRASLSSGANGVLTVVADATINKDCTSLLPFVLNRDTYTTWWHNLVAVKTLSNKSQAYWHGHAPWPVQDRDFITQDTVSQDPKTLAVTYAMLAIASDEVPVQPKRVRMTTMSSRLTLMPVSDSSCLVTFNIAASPGGAIPLWAANLIAKETPVQSLVNLKKLIESGAAVPPVPLGSFAEDAMKKIKLP